MGITEEQLRDELRQKLNRYIADGMTAKAFASIYGFSPAYISDVLNGKRGLADRLGEALGYRRVVTFEPLHKDQTNDG